MTDKQPTTIQDNRLSGSLSTDVGRGTIFMVILRFLIRLSGLVSITVIARILSPEDFAIVASASLILGLLIMFQEFGLGEIIVKNQTKSTNLVNTVWTLQIGLSACLTVFILLTAPLLTSWINDVRVTPVLQLIAFIPFINALANPAAPFFARDMNFGAIFRLRFTQKWVQIILTVSATLYLRSYWALAIGMFGAAIVNAALTYKFHSFRPKLSLENLDDIKSFAIFTYWRNFATFLANSTDEFVVRRVSASNLFGEYHMARDLCRIFISELIEPVRTALLPAMSILKQDDERLRQAVHKFNIAAFLLAMPVAAGVIITAPEFTPILLGYKWNGVVPFIQAIAIGIAANSISATYLSIFAALDRQKLAASIWSVKFIAILSGSAIALYFGNIITLSITFSAIMAIMTVIELFIIRNLVKANFNIIDLMWRPFVSTGCMVLCLDIISPYLMTLPTISILFLKVIFGVLIYAVSLILFISLPFSERHTKIFIIENINNFIKLPFSKQNISQ